MPEISSSVDNVSQHEHNAKSRTILDPQRLDLFRRVALSINSSLDLGAVVQTLLTEAQTLLAAGSWSVWLLDEDGTTLTCREAQGPSGDALRGFQVTLDRGVIGWVVRNNSSVYVKDLRNDPRRDDHIPARNHMLAASMIGCPLNVVSRKTGAITTIGSLAVVSNYINGFNDEDVELIEVLAASAATAIQNARLYEQSRQEIERRQHVEDALRESESRYRTLVETSPDSILLLSLEGRILMCNHRTLALHGYKRSTDLLGKSYLGLIVPEARPEIMTILRNITQGQTPHNQEITLVRSDGTPFAGELSAIITADSRGEPASVVIFARSIADRKEAETAMRRHNLELRVLNDIATHINQSHDRRHLLESALDRTLDTLEIDTGWAVLFDPDCGGLHNAEVEISRGVLSKPEIAERSTGLLRQLVEQICHTQQPVILRSVELFELYAGASAPCNVVAVPLIAHDQVIGALTVAGLYHRHPRDISFRQVQLLAAIGHQISAAIDNARLTLEAAEVDMLRRLDQMRADLIANFSHDLRSPLGLIKMTCSTLLRDDIDFDRATQKDFLGDIILQTDRLSRLIEGILDLGKLEAGQMILDCIPMDLGTLMQQLLHEAQQQGLNHQFTLDLGDKPLTVIADSVLIDRVLHNLLDNAIKYSPSGGRIDIRGHRTREKVLFSISDSGIGIPEEHLDLIFERFYRVRETATEHISGAGLGLTTCRGIVEAHGGKIWATSAPGKGSTFTFSLPAASGVPEE